MYIPQFVCGIAATLIAEIAALVAYSIYITFKKRR